MRLLHTADWHLGHTLHGLDREFEQREFLAWLLHALKEERPDAFVLAGDVFETTTPSARAERLFFDFLAEARQLLPELDVVIVGGNHDSAVRLEAPATLLRRLGVHVVASLGRQGEQPLDTERLLIPLQAKGQVAAWLLAVPFLRPVDLPGTRAAQGNTPEEGVHAIYQELLQAALARRQPGQALLATGHCHIQGASLSETSERPVWGRGGISDQVFPTELAYVALGHLHRAQAVGGREGVRYAGSPLPLSMTELDYTHQVCLVELSGETLQEVRSLPIPRAVDLLRIPREQPLPLEEVLPLLEALPESSPEEDRRRRPYLEVRVALDQPQPRLRAQVEEALSNKRARLVKLSVTRPAGQEALADEASHASLSELEPLEVFRRCYRRRHATDPPPEYEAAFSSLLAEVGQEETAPVELPAAPEPKGANQAEQSVPA